MLIDIAIRYLATIGLLLLHCLAWSQANDQPLTIDADNAVVNQIEKTTIYTGNVVLTQANLQLDADTLIISLDDDKVDSISAQGTPVKIARTDEQQCRIEGRGQRLVYTPSDEVIILMGNAQLNQQQTTLEGERIVYNFNNTILKSAGRTRTIFPLPSSAKPIACQPQQN